MNDLRDAAYNSLVTSVRTLPWLQDTPEDKVWSRWNVVWRDVRVLDPHNQLFATFNLTTNDLALENNRVRLRDLFLQAARATDADRDGLPDAWEVRHFTTLAFAPEEDPDSDGRNNFTEFAFGSDPVRADQNPPVQSLLASVNGRDSFTVHFLRPAGQFLT